MNQVYRQFVEVEDRLTQLGLTRGILHDAVAVGLVGWFSCTHNHPLSFPGTYAWAETVRALREGLLPTGWDRLNDRNLPLTVNTAINVAITASSGDECTGIEQFSPRTRNPKGSVTKERAESNAVQLGLFTDMTTPPAELLDESEKWDTWLLLTYRDLTARVVRSELSKPINIGADGRVDDWHERIILDEIPFDTDQFLVNSGGNGSGRNSDGSLGLDNQSEIIDVAVRRKA